ncbi:hypothetical protein RM572_01260 [Streptomyces sp. DSM 42041]|uniref:Uncharacterized protein n=1 Tax=Streptomyces hazeniae TaxID=3075538 RepID=A0ABU2NMW9_9ACTN|nr:hypothetical protein [Streptomyces sp. DSM 42041]MDT0377402.1 hypothetical protein [Streptomyces sp. DSM 42041]
MSDPGMQQGGVGATAADFPPTAQSLKTVLRAWTAVLAAAPLFAALGVLLLAMDGDYGFYLVIFGVGMTVGALLWLSYARKMRAALQRGPWAACRATTVSSGLNNPTVVVQDPGTAELRVYVARTALWSMDWADPGPAGVLWWAAHPEGGAVVCRPGGTSLVWVKPLRAGRKRDAGLAQAAQRGLMQQPGGQPQGWGGQPQPHPQAPYPQAPYPQKQPPQQQPGWTPPPGGQGGPGWGQQPPAAQPPHPQQQPGWGPPPQAPQPGHGPYPGQGQGGHPGQGSGGGW